MILVTCIGRAASYWPQTFFTPRVFLFNISLLFVNVGLLTTFCKCQVTDSISVVGTC